MNYAIFHDLDIKLKHRNNGMMDQVVEESTPSSQYPNISSFDENDPSSSNIVMGQFLKDNIIRGQTILEIGSGSGICGLYAAKLGANVILTEKEIEGIHLLNENIKLNECTLSSVAIGLSPVMGIHSLPSFINLISRPFDIIMASDLIQSSFSVESILQMFSFVSAILKSQYHSNTSSSSYFLMSYNCETTSELTIRKTIEIADRFGLKSERIINMNNDNNTISSTSTTPLGQLWKFEPKVYII
ncbi:hypothetical protein PPL_03128 [Heterostelium album PN500]|uniref:Uncharacterized protein n=1 Tax=Heterostelium pallidum (strain ATCC 26659 / Pp 5 / PN500) TaxID=670386 RepID=D3B407_HETP5|nr:hypothetical protein PPL_03128 [Heterostelium album PN500]EFA84055.1 hypothetical protein PPL_03128 [Heterostelium album PN500]|eukprot:XP_020436172.1 hypothetical protein PPL_03128 [Heterostelium album PN500]